MERRRMRIPLRNQDRPAYPSSRIFLGSRLPRWRKIFRPDEEQKIARAPPRCGSFRVAIVCCARPLKKRRKKRKEERKKEPRAAGRTGWLALARNSTCQEYLKNWISLSHPRAGWVREKFIKAYVPLYPVPQPPCDTLWRCFVSS